MALVPLNNESELLAKIATGDQRAFNELFEAYYNPLGDYVLKVTKSLNVAEEIVQDTFVTVWLKRDGLPQVKHFTNYLFILCRNRTLDHIRKQVKERAFSAQLESYLKQQSEMDQQDNPGEIYRVLIDQAIRKLPPQAQRVYILSRHQRLKHEEIARELNISTQTVKKHVQYAINFIKKDVSAHVELALVAVLLSPLIF